MRCLYGSESARKRSLFETTSESLTQLPSLAFAHMRNIGKPVAERERWSRSDRCFKNLPKAPNLMIARVLVRRTSSFRNHMIVEQTVT